MDKEPPEGFTRLDGAQGLIFFFHFKFKGSRVQELLVEWKIVDSENKQMLLQPFRYFFSWDRFSFSVKEERENIGIYLSVDAEPCF